MTQVKAKIYRPAKTAMQSGKAKTQHWVLEYLPDVKNTPDPLMGWSSGGTLQQIKLKFNSVIEAVAYANKHQIAYEVLEPKQHKTVPKQYAANFAGHRILPF